MSATSQTLRVPCSKCGREMLLQVEPDNAEFAQRFAGVIVCDRCRPNCPTRGPAARKTAPKTQIHTKTGSWAAFSQPHKAANSKEALTFTFRRRRTFSNLKIETMANERPIRLVQVCELAERTGYAASTARKKLDEFGIVPFAEVRHGRWKAAALLTEDQALLFEQFVRAADEQRMMEQTVL
jgi:hypothetical protein